MRQAVIEDGVLLFQDDILVFDVAKTVDYGLDFFVHVANAVSLEMRRTQHASANVALIGLHYANYNQIERYVIISAQGL